MSLAPGTRIRRYEVQTPLGAGGMGEVYLARDVELDRLVALKILPRGDDARDEDRVHRFLQEARAAISLSHPNVAHIYDAGDADGLRFMAMEYVQGETLRTRLLRTRLSMDEALEIAQQIALALASAHDAGIVHRDIKPENVMLRPDGYVKVLDFGLAKLTVRDHGPEASTAVMQTAPGVVMGTTHYMSPEQLRGDAVDARSDVFSLGVVLYEMAGGRRPFEASSSTGVVATILTEDPPRLEGIPEQVDQLLVTALAKNREQRYPTAREMAEALKKARHDTQRIRSGDVPTQALTRPIPQSTRSRRIWIAAAALLLVLLAAGAWLAKRTLDVRNARATLPEIERLMADARYFEAWDLAQKAQVVLGSDERLVRALQAMSEPLTVESKPPGAEVFLERVLPDGSTGARKLVGATPLAKHPIARGHYILTVEKIGFAPLRRPVSAQPLRVAGTTIPQPPPPFELTLVESSKVPQGMALVEGGPYRLTGWMPVTEASVTLDPFFIDQYEVSNADFERFVRAGGYRRREWWKHPFEKDGKTLSFEEAMPLLRDATGLPGPRSWAQSRPPHGRESYPVTDITWYEAAAYAEFTGKKLPTIYQWDKAARNGGRAFAAAFFRGA